MSKGTVTIRRFDPARDSAPYWQTFSFTFQPGMTVLDVLLEIYQQQDATLSFQYCCRNGHCGLCGVMINGRPGMICRETASAEMRLEPLANLPVLRDLTVDRSEQDLRKQDLRLFLDRAEPYRGESAERIDMEAFARFKRAARCMECFCCVAVCPVFTARPHDFIGPAAFTQLARHFFDPRDEGRRKLTALTNGLTACIRCGKCTDVCPHDAMPMENIIAMQEMAAKE